MPGTSRNPQPGGRQPSLRGLLVVDAVRGSIRVRAWPKPRGENRNATNKHWSAWLKAVTYLYRYQPASVQAQLMRDTKGTVWMPRDIFIAAVRGRAWLIQDEFGRKYYPLAMVNEVSESLDAIAQLPGQMMYRGPTLWLPLGPGNPGDVLTFGASDAPEWAPASGGAGYQVLRLVGGQASVANWPINATTYQRQLPWDFTFDCDEFSFNDFRILVYGNSTQSGQTATLQLATQAAVATPLSAAGDDLVVPFSTAWHDSGWVAMASPLTGFQFLTIGTKGSNATVDISAQRLELHLR